MARSEEKGQKGVIRKKSRKKKKKRKKKKRKEWKCILFVKTQE